MGSKRHGSLFSGIGGFDLAAEWMGWENVFHCEWNSFGQKVLKHYWPNAISYEDITKTDFTIHRGTIDILTGGFPCQPYSMAGKRLGKEDERHLWPEMLRAIREIQPTWVVGENVFGLVNWSGGLVFHEVQADLEAQGYEVQPYVLPACAVNAPHRRDRIWFVAYATGNGYDAESDTGDNAIRQNNKQSRAQRKRTSEGLSNEWNASDTDSNGFNGGDCQHEEQPSEGWFNALCDINQGNGNGDSSDSNSSNSEARTQREILGQQNRKEANGHCNVERRNQWQNFPTQSPIYTGDDGISARLDGITFSKWRNESIKAGGNAIVPQVVYQIFKAIEQYDTPPLSRTLHQ
jgi:DNA (cytosine-5)-methyltransferase 1